MAVSREAARRERRERAAARPEAQPAAVDVAARADLHRSLVDTVLSLEEPCRTVLLLHYFDGRKLREIADELDKPVGTVKTWLHRGLERMRTLLDESHGDRRSWCVALAPLAAKAAAPSPALIGAAPLWAWVLGVAVAMAIGWLGWTSWNGGRPRPDPVGPAAQMSSGAANDEIDGEENPAAVVQSDRQTVVADHDPGAEPTPSIQDPTKRIVATLVDTSGKPVAGARLIYRSKHWPVALGGDEVRIGDTTLALTDADLAAMRAHPERTRAMAFLVPEARRAVAAWLLDKDALAEASTDAQGRFELEGTDDWWQVELQRPGWMIYADAEDESGRLLVAGPGAEMAGRVVGETGAPIEDAYLSIDGVFDRLPEWERETVGEAYRSWGVQTDAEGSFDLGRVPLHPHLRLNIQKRGFVNQSVDVPRGGDRNAHFVLVEAEAPQVLTGRVVFADGRPAAAAGLMFGQDGATADERGEFRVELTYWNDATVLGAYLEPYQPALVHGLGAAIRERESSGHDLELTLGPELLEIEGRVVDAAGRPLVGAVIGIANGIPFGNIQSTTFESWLGGWKQGSLRTDEDGRFTIPGLSSRGLPGVCADRGDLCRRPERACTRRRPRRAPGGSRRSRARRARHRR